MSSSSIYYEYVNKGLGNGMKKNPDFGVVLLFSVREVRTNLWKWAGVAQTKQTRTKQQKPPTNLVVVANAFSGMIKMVYVRSTKLEINSIQMNAGGLDRSSLHSLINLRICCCCVIHIPSSSQSSIKCCSRLWVNGAREFLCRLRGLAWFGLVATG